MLDGTERVSNVHQVGPAQILGVLGQVVGAVGTVRIGPIVKPVGNVARVTRQQWIGKQRTLHLWNVCANRPLVHYLMKRLFRAVGLVLSEQETTKRATATTTTKRPR